MKFLLYLFFLVPFIVQSLKSSAHSTKKERVFISFCDAVLQNEISKVLELMHHHSEEIEAFINDPHRSSCVHSTSMHYAAFTGNKRLMSLLLDLGADPFKKNSIHFNSFDYAQQNHKAAALKEAIEGIQERDSAQFDEVGSWTLPQSMNDRIIHTKKKVTLALFAFISFLLYYRYISLADATENALE